MRAEKSWKIVLVILSLGFIVEFVAMLFAFQSIMVYTGDELFIIMTFQSGVYYAEIPLLFISAIIQLPLTIIYIIFTHHIGRLYKNDKFEKFITYNVLGSIFTILIPLFKTIPFYYVIENLGDYEKSVNINLGLYMSKLVLFLVGGIFFLISWMNLTKLVQKHKRGRNTGIFIQIIYYITNIATLGSIIFTIFTFYEANTGQSVPNSLFDSFSLMYLFQPIAMPLLFCIGLLTFVFTPQIENMVNEGTLEKVDLPPRKIKQKRSRLPKKERYETKTTKPTLQPSLEPTLNLLEQYTDILKQNDSITQKKTVIKRPAQPVSKITAPVEETLEKNSEKSIIVSPKSSLLPQHSELPIEERREKEERKKLEKARKQQERREKEERMKLEKARKQQERREKVEHKKLEKARKQQERREKEEIKKLEERVIQKVQEYRDEMEKLREKIERGEAEASPYYTPTSSPEQSRGTRENGEGGGGSEGAAIINFLSFGVVGGIAIGAAIGGMEGFIVGLIVGAILGTLGALLGYYTGISVICCRF